ncbi:hypothetical protein T440DRAFT_488154 [Plenodomus tracheiphilus IPT5]|uniref:Uncharacterized protein n=1 Tax=Plenodomus tracheiphilus IPT5 TaxID=1408161 RepID=A0A6A7BEI9_9PLEO|nr:hypothetical protein T440DRAFT_488154 [Plenodomus tracheiphilus IPT5]
MTISPSIIRFFDIASGPPKRTYAPNPWKTRYALNVKSVPYQTEWVELPDVKATRLAHGVAPVRKLPDDSDYYTLPFIHDGKTDTYVGDSFDIAVYLDQQYPESGLRLFSPGSIDVHRVFNAHVDALFSRNIILAVSGLPFNPETAELSRAEFVSRARLSCWDDLVIKGEAREKLIEAFKADMEEFAKLYRFDDGPFLEGKAITYADIIVGGWLAMLMETLPEWDQVCKWQGGHWKRLHEALAPWAGQKQ